MQSYYSRASAEALPYQLQEAYLDLPLIAIAVLGTIIAVVTAQRDMQLKNNQAAPAAAVEKMSEEEDFFA